MNSRKHMGVGILGVGSAVPERVLTNDDLSRMVETSDEWITSRTGIKERHILAPGELPSSITAKAARAAIADAGLTTADIDAVIVGTFTPDFVIPSTACVLQGQLDIPSCIAFDLNAACSGFVFGLAVAEGLVRSGACRHPLVAGMDCVSRYLNFTDRDTCVLFGDGAGAAVLGEVEPGRGFLGSHFGADGKGGENITVRDGAAGYPLTEDTVHSPNRFVKMNGRDVYRFATRVMGEAVERALADAGMAAADLDFVVPHQANIRIIQSAAERLNMPMEKFVINVHRFGNTSAGSVAIALDTAREEGRLVPDAVGALVAFGAGLTYGSIIVRW